MLDINYNGVTLAYIGDAVIELAVREALISSGITDTGRLSFAAQKLVQTCGSFLKKQIVIDNK